MAKKDYIVIQLPEWDGWRIAGDDREWQMQRLVDGKNGEEWRGTNYWPSIEYAVSYAYERMLRESGKTITSTEELIAECKRVKDALLKAVRKAVIS